MSSSSGNEDTANSEEQGAMEAGAQDAAQTLIKLLEDPQGRQALIEALRKSDGETAPQGAEQTDTPPAESQSAGAAGTASAAENVDDSDPPLAVVLGSYTRLMLDEGWTVVGRVQHFMRGFLLIAQGDVTLRWSRFSDALWQVVQIIAAASLSFWVLQRLVAVLYRKIAPKGVGRGIIWRLKYLVPLTLLDALTLALATLVGVTVAFYREFELNTELTNFQTFALNAFFLTHLFVIGLRLIFAPARSGLRLLPVQDSTATYWSRRLVAVTLWLGYGVMLAVPIANVGVSFVVGNTVKFVVVFGVVIYLLGLIRSNRGPVRRGMKAYAQNMSSEIASRALDGVARIWDLLAMLYVLTVFGIWLSRPLDAFTIAIQSTGLTLVTVAAGFLLSAVATRAIVGGVRLPEELRVKLPALQGRINAFVPRILKIFRFLVALVTILLLLDIWGVVSFISWVSSAGGQLFLGRYFSAFLVVIVAFCIWLAVMAWIDLRLREHSGYVVTARVRTLFQLFRNAFTVIILVMGTLLSLSEIGVDIGPLIAGAGVVGLAISFGAQTLVKDIITGAFIQIENAINEGDVVTVGGTTGVVERLTVRSVRLRDLDGVTHIVPFSAVDTVSNFMRDFAFHVAVIGVSYDTDIKQAKAAMTEAFNRLKASELGVSILEDLEMHGVTEFADSSVNIRARIKTLPGDQWSTGRAYNEFVKEVFDEQGIEIPFPQVTYHSGMPPAVVESSSKMAKAHDDVDMGESDAAPTGAQSKPDTDMPDGSED
ncbi:mechanosensitive ion channel [Roseibium sp. CAU 1637]|uniref:Mechanosensitive ion channel n=1 Tax=Roseibium limicola TaxID=2816037 RepID=A0A939EQX2_9HYPH|nr:mechanosensitive ion channel domain-containing protein [Roseibium limicola]MBO0346873.1 mechanosensitive ion channel [Roseibium limicola]